MSKTLVPWLAGAAAVALLAAGSVATAQDPAGAARQAAADARVAADKARVTAQDAREKAEKARKYAHEAADKARKEVRIYRSGGKDGDVFVFRSGDRSEHLRTILQLRPEQETALKTYLEAVGHGGHRDYMVRFDRDRAAGKTTADRLAEMEAKMAEQQAAMRTRIDATKAFYAQLDDRQKKVFDSMPMLMFAGPGFGPMLLPVGVHMPVPPAPPAPPVPPRAPML